MYLDGILQGEWNINVTSKLFEVQPIIKRAFTPMERRRDDVVLMQGRNWPCLFHKRIFIKRRIATLAYVLQYSSHCKTSFAAVRNIPKSKGNIFHSIPYLNYLGTPLQVLLSYGNITSILCFNY